jgi:SAM-dependent methyltransferase
VSKKSIDEFFDDLCDKHGSVGWKASHWDDAENQTFRFQMIANKIMNGEIPSSYEYILFWKNTSVLDVGCGQCDFYDYIVGIDKYLGIDLSSKMIENSKSKYPNVNSCVADIVTFEASDKFDFVISSGLFGYRNFEEKDQYRYAANIIEKMKSHASSGVVFNMMSTHLPDAAKNLSDIDNFCFYDPAKILEFCLSITDSKRVSLDHYLPYEFMVYIDCR